MSPEEWAASQSKTSEPKRAPSPEEWASKQEPSFGEKYIQPVTDVVNRSLVAGTLGAPADIGALALRPFGYTQEPTFGSEYIGRQMEKAGMVSSKRRPVAELLTGFAPLALTGGVSALRSGAGMVGRALGKDVTREAEALKKATAGRYEAPISQAEKERERASRAIEQIERQPSVAAQRAATAPLTREQEIAQLQAQLRQPVREQMGARRAAAEERAGKAAVIEEQAAQRTAAAQQAVDVLEQRLLSRPTITPEQFGAELRQATKDLQKRLVDARTEGSNLGRVIRNAGTTPNINTSGLVNRAEGLALRTRNPQVLGMLEEVKSLAKVEGDEMLTLEQADSLRKYLSKDIINKFFPTTGADKEVLRALRSLRVSLIQATPQAYRKALGEFSTLSRPLDIVERQGALKRVVDIDPVSTAEKLTEAQVVGEVINKARAGNPVFTRLLEGSPQLKDSARLYFTQDLFGKGVVPTEASVRTWLRNNERVLRQVGLYDEFKDIRTAKETAQRAVDEAKLTEKAAREVAGATAKEAGRAGKLSKESETRLQEALRTTASPTQRPGESLAEALRRTRTGEKPAPIQTFVQTREKQAQAVQSLTKMQSDVVAAKTPQEIQSAVSTAANDLLKRGIIDDAGYRTMIRDVSKLQDMTDARNQARKIVAYFAGLAGVGFLGRGAVQSVVEGR